MESAKELLLEVEVQQRVLLAQPHFHLLDEVENGREDKGIFGVVHGTASEVALIQTGTLMLWPKTGL